MTIYVDSYRVAATVGRTRARWSHLISDQLDPAELHEFAARIGMRREWFQEGRPHPVTGVNDPVHAHYDVTDSRRRDAIAAGAVQVDLRQMSELLSAKRAEWRALQPPRENADA